MPSKNKIGDKLGGAWDPNDIRRYPISWTYEKIDKLVRKFWYDLYGRDKVSESTQLSEALFGPELKITKIDEKHYRIEGLWNDTFVKDIKKYIPKAYRFLQIFHTITERKFLVFSKTIVIVHTFFIPEVYFICKHLYEITKKHTYKVYYQTIYRQTWLSEPPPFPTKIDLSRLSKLKRQPLQHQKEFIEQYPKKKDALHLRGLLLLFDQGLGKTFTSIALMYALNKTCVVVACPKSLLEVWRDEVLNTCPFKPDEVYVIGDKKPVTKKTKYIIVNYEQLDKVSDLLQDANLDNLGFILDESQNFRYLNTQRVKKLITLIDSFPFTDCLVLSGTPIKGRYSELAPAIYVIDPKMDDEALKIFTYVFNVDEAVGYLILRFRLESIAVRKTKENTLNLPPRHFITVEITLPNAKKYEIETIKQEAKILAKKYLEKYKKQYLEKKQELIRFLASLLDDPKTPPDVKRYLLMYLHFIQSDKDGTLILNLQYQPEKRKQFVEIENKIIQYIKKIKKLGYFKQLRSYVVALPLKAMGKAIGEIFHKRRAELTVDLFLHAKDKVKEFIKKSTKTVIFTLYESITPKLKEIIESLGFTVEILSGKTKNRSAVVKEFQNSDTIKVLICTYQVASVGLTLTAANTVIYADFPYREADLKQALDRVYRIGQVHEVFVYYLKLKHNKPTIQDKAEEIVKFYKQIVDLLDISKDVEEVEKELEKEVKQ